MKKLCIFLSIVLITVIPEVSAQLSSRYQGIRTGDKIVKQQLPYVAPGEAGEGRLWDFSRLPESSREYTVEYTAPGLWRDSVYIMGLDTFPKEAIRPGELITAMEFYTAYYYRQTDSALFLLGYENPSTLVHYDRPFCQMRYPLDTLHRIDTDYRAETIYSPENKYRTEGNLQIFPDASGRLVLPSGDTLPEVTRIKIIQTSRSDGKDSASRPSVTMETYKWYAAGYRYPIFESLRILHTDTLQPGDVFATSFFYPPDEHTYLEDDMPNLTILDERQKERGNDSGPDENRLENPVVCGTGWSCGFYPNPVGACLHIEYRTDRDMPVLITLHDIGGRLLKKLSYTLQKAGTYRETIDTGTLPTGSYICKFNFGTESESQILIKK